MAGRNKAVKLGVIGCGRVTETRHLPALQRLPDAEVVAVADINPDRLRQVADRFHIEQRYTDFLALLQDPDIEAVAVCVPAQFHVEAALAALDAGKHLFIEKPLALSLEEADRLIERAAQSPCKVMVGFNMRWHRLVQQTRMVVQRGALGSLEAIRTVLTGYHESVSAWREQRALGGGALFEQAVHSFDLWRFLLQSEVEEVFAFSRSGRWEDETVAVTARMSNDALATAVCLERTSESNEVEIYGQTGRLRASCYHFDGLEVFSSASPPYTARARLRKVAHTLRELPQGVLGVRHGGDYVASYQAEWRHFLDAIRHDTPVGCTLEDGRRALQVVLAAVESASLGRPVKVAQTSYRVARIAIGQAS